MLRLNRSLEKDLTPDQLQRSQNTLAVLKKYAPPSVVQFFAVPVATKEGRIDWLSSHSGQIKTYQNLPAPAQDSLLELANQHTKTVRLLQEALQKEGKTEEAGLLSPLTVKVKSEYLYAVNGSPVYTHWTKANLTESASSVSPTPISTPVAAAPLAATSKKRGCFWLLLLLLLLLLFLGALVFWWFSKEPKQKLNKSIEITESSTQNMGTKFACQTEDSDPPEFTIIFDTSGSMLLNVDITQEEENWYYTTEFTTAEHIEKALKLEQGISRFSVAKDAMLHMINDLHAQVPTKLISFESCGEIIDHGTFSAKRRAELLSTLLSLEPRGGTPSAQALAYAAQKMNGVDQDGIIILVIDGEDGCEANICQIADSIAQTKPRIRVNVVDITGFGLSNCVAEKTTGRVYSSNNTHQINKMMRDSIEEIATNPNCHDE